MMNKNLIAAAALLAVAGTASAQSSVTLYGILDVNVAQSKAFDGTKTSGMNVYNPTNPRGSRFGLRGSEDLGGGYKGIFQLEGGINSENGNTTANSQLFNRHAWVGLSAGWGDITVGRQETLHRIMNVGGYGDVSSEAELSVVTANSGLQLMQNFGTRVNQAVRYTSPTIAGGVKVRVQSAMGQRSTASVNGMMVTYDQGPLKVALVHEYYDGAGVAGISKWNEVTTINGAYNFGVLTATAGFQQTNKLAASATANPATGNLPKAEAYNLGVIVPVGKALRLAGQYTVSTTKTPAAGTVAAFEQDYSRAGVSARYSLSPRTFLYAAYSEKKVDYAPTATAAAIATLKAGNNKNSVGLGISHAF